MAITSGKSTVKADIETKFESQRAILKSQLKSADDVMLTLTDASQNNAKRDERYELIMDMLKLMVVETLDQFFDSYSNNITTNAQVDPNIAVQVSPATGTGATTAPGTIS